MPAITAEQLENASTDADTLGQFTNAPSGDVSPREGADYPNIRKLIDQVLDGGGLRTFADETALQAYEPDLPTIALVLSDPIEAWKFDGSLPWVEAPEYFDAIAAVVQPLVDDAEAAYNATINLVAATPVALTAANSEAVREGIAKRVTLDHTTAGVNMWDSLKTTETTAVFPQDGSNSRIHLSWDASEKGFTEGGILVEAEVRTGQLLDRTNAALATTTGAKLQVWVVRPTATPSDVNNDPITFSLVGIVGEQALDDNKANYRDNIKFGNLKIPVNAGDMLAMRIIGAGIRYGVNSGGTHEYDSARSTLLSVADQTLSGAFSVNRSGQVTAGTTSASGRRFFHRVRIIKNGIYDGASGGPGTMVRLDQAGRVPASVSRVPDNPWHGKKIAVFGSSISTYTGGGTGAIKGHIPTIMEALQCDAYYYAVGSSYGLWPPTNVTPGGTAQVYSGMTAAEESARFSGSAIYSYENRWTADGPFDAVLMHDLINDTNVSVFSIGSQGSTDRATLWGNFSRQIEYFLTQNPKCQILLQSPAHPWASYAGSGAPSISTVGGATRIQWTAAMEAIRSYYGLPPMINFIEYGGISSYRVQSGTGLIDVIHPAETNGPKPQMAQHGYNRFRDAGYLAMSV